MTDRVLPNLLPSPNEKVVCGHGTPGDRDRAAAAGDRRRDGDVARVARGRSRPAGRSRRRREGARSSSSPTARAGRSIRARSPTRWDGARRRSSCSSTCGGRASRSSSRTAPRRAPTVPIRRAPPRWRSLADATGGSVFGERQPELRRRWCGRRSGAARPSSSASSRTRGRSGASSALLALLPLGLRALAAKRLELGEREGAVPPGRDEEVLPVRRLEHGVELPAR